MVLFTNNIKPMSNAEYRKHAENAYNEKVRLAEAENQKDELEYHKYMLEKNQAFHDLLEDRANRVKGFQKRENWFKSVKDAFVIEGGKINRLAKVTDSRNTEQVIRLQNILKGMGVFEELKKYGLKNGDVVILGGLELAYYDDEFWGDEAKG